ncbi:MAG: hypothetical protein QXO32_05020 [Candidatus Bathyarchaeia archaeon]
MSFGRGAPQQKPPMRRSAITMRNIAYLCRTNPNIKTENEAKLFLAKLQRQHPKESIRVTKEGLIFCEAEDGTITKLGIDGKIIEVYRPTSEAAKKARALFPHYDEEAGEGAAKSEAAKKTRPFPRP